MKYKVGDVVKVRKDLRWGSEYNCWMVTGDMLKYRGMTVTIARVDSDHYHIKEDGVSWAWTDEMLEPADVRKIVVTVAGATTIARLYINAELKKEAKAVCSKDDTFNFDVGAKLAMERLMAEDKPKLYNGRVVCVDTGTATMIYTKGKIYQFRDGVAYDDAGHWFHCCVNHPITSFDELRRGSLATWLEVVE